MGCVGGAPKNEACGSRWQEKTRAGVCGARERLRWSAGGVWTCQPDLTGHAGGGGQGGGGSGGGQRAANANADHAKAHDGALLAGWSVGSLVGWLALLILESCTNNDGRSYCSMMTVQSSGRGRCVIGDAGPCSVSDRSTGARVGGVSTRQTTAVSEIRERASCGLRCNRTARKGGMSLGLSLERGGVSSDAATLLFAICLHRQRREGGRRESGEEGMAKTRGQKHLAAESAEDAGRSASGAHTTRHDALPVRPRMLPSLGSAP